jgi:hypothetical protein
VEAATVTSFQNSDIHHGLLMSWLVVERVVCFMIRHEQAEQEVVARGKEGQDLRAFESRSVKQPPRTKSKQQTLVTTARLWHVYLDLLGPRVVPPSKPGARQGEPEDAKLNLVLNFICHASRITYTSGKPEKKLNLYLTRLLPNKYK